MLVASFNSIVDHLLLYNRRLVLLLPIFQFYSRSSKCNRSDSGVGYKVICFQFYSRSSCLLQIVLCILFLYLSILQQIIHLMLSLGCDIGLVSIFQFYSRSSLGRRGDLFALSDLFQFYSRSSEYLRFSPFLVMFRIFQFYSRSSEGIATWVIQMIMMKLSILQQIIDIKSAEGL